MSDTIDQGGTYDSPRQGDENSAAFVRMWLDALARADEEEKEWRRKAEDTLEIYRGKRASRGRKFNILHSNVETLCPALYNSTPVPDVRRRFSDPDPVAKTVCDLIERALSFSVDTYDFDCVMKAVIRDGEIAGRGVPRVRYVPVFAPAYAPLRGATAGKPEESLAAAEHSGASTGEPVSATLGADKSEDLSAEAGATTGKPEADLSAEAPAGAEAEEVVYEEVACDYVPWRYFRRGPGRTWKDVTWIAFGDFLTRDELRRLTGGATDRDGKPVADCVPLNHMADTRERKPGADEQSIFRRALVWQIWDKERRRVISLAPDYPEAALALVPDPLGLTDFFPVPRPYQPIAATDSPTPIVPYEIYEDLVEELNDITARINRLVKQLRPRGGYASTQHESLKAIAEADDGELVPLTGIEHLVGEGGLERAIVWFPLDPTVNALRLLVQQRAEIKQVIYEVTGIADILRGATNPGETLGAQQLKAQWGSLRIQDRQAEAARVARDLFRLKAEIIAQKFSWQTLAQMTGIVLPSAAEKMLAQQALAQRRMAAQTMPMQPGARIEQSEIRGEQPSDISATDAEIERLATSPTREDVETILRSDVIRRYRIDIESDSTIRGDLARNQQVMVSFVQGTAQYAQAMGPLIGLNPGLMPAAVQLYAAFARQFKLGKQAEDELERLIDEAGKGKVAAPRAP